MYSGALRPGFIAGANHTAEGTLKNQTLHAGLVQCTLQDSICRKFE